MGRFPEVGGLGRFPEVGGLERFPEVGGLGARQAGAGWEGGAGSLRTDAAWQAVRRVGPFPPPLLRRAHSPDDGRLLQSLCYHKDAVTCLAASAGALCCACLPCATCFCVLLAAWPPARARLCAWPVRFLERRLLVLHMMWCCLLL